MLVGHDDDDEAKGDDAAGGGTFHIDDGGGGADGDGAAAVVGGHDGAVLFHDATRLRLGAALVATDDDGTIGDTPRRDGNNGVIAGGAQILPLVEEDTLLLLWLFHVFSSPNGC